MSTTNEQIVIDGPNMSHGAMAHADHAAPPHDSHGAEEAHGHHEHHEPHFIFKYLFSQDHKYIAKQFLITGIIWAIIGALILGFLPASAGLAG